MRIPMAMLPIQQMLLLNNTDCSLSMALIIDHFKFPESANLEDRGYHPFFCEPSMHCNRLSHYLSIYLSHSLSLPQYLIIASLEWLDCIFQGEE